jgi:hypothetical protein
VTSADAMYGPITTLRRNNTVKNIPWSAFKMSDRDWSRVVDARDILGVSTFNFMPVTTSNTFPSIRIPIESSSTFPPKNNQPSGVHFLLSKSYKPHGRLSAIHRDMPCIRTPSMMVLRRSGSITHVWTRNPVLFWHLVSSPNSLSWITNDEIFASSPPVL